MKDSFGARKTLRVGGKTYKIASLAALEKRGASPARLPFSMRILLENLLRLEDGSSVTAEAVEAVAKWDPAAAPDREIAFTPARVILQDFTGVPCVVDLAAMRDAMKRMGGDPRKINPLQPVELVIDHSVQVDAFGTPDALAKNSEIEFGRNRERYAFLRWGQSALENFKVVPPATGIVHQVNLEYLARVVMDLGGWAYPDTLVGTDSHTTMVNGLGVLGWGVGGIEAEAAMLGQPVSMLIPQVVGFRLTGALPEGATATDMVLTVTQMLRKHGVVGKFVEFFGPALDTLPVADRATIANMAPEYGATCGIFPVDAATLDYLRLTGRSKEQVALVEAYMKEQGLWRSKEAPEAAYTDVLALDLGTVEPSLAGPKRPQDRVRLGDMKKGFAAALPSLIKGSTPPDATAPVKLAGKEETLGHGSVVIAAITSCTNTSNPSVLIAAGLVAKKAVEKGLATKPWVKTSLAPGSKVVPEYLNAAGLTPYLEQLKFHVVGFGCTTCIGNSGPLPPEVDQAVRKSGLVVSAVLSGNRNFEGRVHPAVRANYLASPPLVVAYALAGTVDLDLRTEPLGTGKDGKPVYLKDIWPTQAEIAALVARTVSAAQFAKEYADVYQGDLNWRAIDVPEGDTFAWDPESTYVRNPPYFDGLKREPAPFEDVKGARALAVLGDSITTDHISPAGDIADEGPAAEYLRSRGVEKKDFNSFGARRGNHEVMMRGAFANVRLKNLIFKIAGKEVEGGYTLHQPSGEQMSIFDAAMRYKEDGVPAIVLGGKEYGSGSSRDWAAKGPALQGVRAVIAESYERIHRSNLVGMGVAPLQFKDGDSIASLGLTGAEVYDIEGLAEGVRTGFEKGREVTVRATANEMTKSFKAVVRVDTPQEVEYMRHGGILQYVLRRLLKA